MPILAVLALFGGGDKYGDLTPVKGARHDERCPKTHLLPQVGQTVGDRRRSVIFFSGAPCMICFSRVSVTHEVCRWSAYSAWLGERVSK